jgi:maleate isomerase
MTRADQPGCRVGLLVPSSNTVMEPDFYRGLPEWATLHTARMYLEETTVAGENRMLDSFTMPAAESVGTARPDVVVFGCTSAGALRGDAYDQELCARIAKATGGAVVSVIDSVRAALAGKAATAGRRVGVLTPYVDELNVRVKVSLEASAELDVVDIRGLGIDENTRIGAVTPDEIVDFALATYTGRAIDLLFVSCTNFQALAAVPSLTGALGVPVVTSNQAALEAVLARIGAAREADEH